MSVSAGDENITTKSMEPEASDANTDTPTAGRNAKRRDRIAKACDACYKRKIKCDGVSPRCDWCAHNDSPCTFDRTRGRKKRSSKNDHAQLLNRIDRLEQLLASQSSSHFGLIEPLQSSTPATPLSVEQHTLGTLHFAGRSLGSINSNTGIPVFSEQGQRWIRSRIGTGDNASLERISALSRSWHSSTHSSWGNPLNMINSQTPDALELPCREMVDRYVDLYQYAFTCHVFPIIDPVRFRNTVATAYAQTSLPSTYQEYSAQACVYSFLAFVSFFNFGDNVHAPPIENPDEYALKAQRILTVCCLDISIETLQVSSMLTLIHLFSGNLHYALLQASTCARMIYMLGAHTTTYPSCTDAEIIASNTSYRERYLLRNIFWVIYSMDKELSLRTGQPPVLQDEHCDINLPPPHVLRCYPGIMNYHIEETYDSLHMFPGHMALSLIKSKAYSALYSTRAVGKSDTELLRDIRELDDDLERWRLSIPVTHRPTISFSRGTIPESGRTMLSVMLHLDYCHCVAAIHQATSRCQAWSFGDHDEAAGVGTSLALGIEASRSSLAYLERAHRVIDDDAFWTILYYPISALLTVFYSILHRPLDPKSLEDLELISNVPSTIRKIPLRRLTKNESNQIQLIDELVQSLTELGRCAINKASGTCAINKAFGVGNSPAF